MQEALSAFLAKSGLAAKLSDGAVMSAWRRAAGEELSRRARAMRFREGELLIEVESAAHLSELQNFTGESLRQAANARLGAERIRRVTFQLQR